MVTSAERWLNRPGGLASRMRAMRDAAGLSGKDIADRLGWAQSKVSRVESGQQKPSTEDVQAWAAACGGDGDELVQLLDEVNEAHQDWRQRMRRGQARVQADYTQLIAEATHIVYVDTVYVPGPLQTADYTRRVLTEMIGLHDLVIDDVDAAVLQRQEQQRMLYDASKRFEFLVGEPVLRYLLVPPAAMRAQLDRLQTVIGLPNVRFGVVPMGVELAVTPQHGFQMYDDVVMLETFQGERRHVDDEVKPFLWALEGLWREAVTDDSARHLITEAAAALGL